MRVIFDKCLLFPPHKNRKSFAWIRLRVNTHAFKSVQLLPDPLEKPFPR